MPKFSLRSCVPAKGYVPQAGELRFDMFEAEFTHVGDRCTFEGLILAASLSDPALQAIAEIVHDIDLKDAKFGRKETVGVAQLISLRDLHLTRGRFCADRAGRRTL
jgi:hypothetical protein